MYHHPMSFYWDTNLGEYLFPGLNIDGVKPLLLLGLVLIILTINYEGIKVYQTKLRARAARERQRSTSCAPSETATLLTTTSNPQRFRLHFDSKFSKKFWNLVGQGFVFLFHTSLGYIIMLSVMVYNGYVFLIIIFGMGLGYFLFGHISMKINMENIRARTTNVLCSTKCPDDPSTSGTQSNIRTGYVNEVSSNSSENSLTDTRSITRIPTIDGDSSNVIHSCRL